jgi:hypothetical protein
LSLAFFLQLLEVLRGFLVAEEIVVQVVNDSG